MKANKQSKQRQQTSDVDVTKIKKQYLLTLGVFGDKSLGKNEAICDFDRNVIYEKEEEGHTRFRRKSIFGGNYLRIQIPYSPMQTHLFVLKFSTKTRGASYMAMRLLFFNVIPYQKIKQKLGCVLHLSATYIYMGEYGSSVSVGLNSVCIMFVWRKLCVRSTLLQNARVTCGQLPCALTKPSLCSTLCVSLFTSASCFVVHHKCVHGSLGGNVTRIKTNQQN